MPELDIRYAETTGGLQIAYTIVGEGPVDVVVVPGIAAHLDLVADVPWYTPLLQHPPPYARMIAFDKRGGGLSDRSFGTGTLEDRMDDVRAVMDAVGVRRASVMGAIDGGPMAIAFAATYPKRVTALVLWTAYARLARAPDYAIGLPRDAYERGVEQTRRLWGTGRVLVDYTVDADDHADALRRLARLERNVGTPRAIAEQFMLNYQTDVSTALPLVQAPTLVGHCAEDPRYPSSWSRYIADRIPNARYVEFPGNFDGSWQRASWEPFAVELEAFLTGIRPPAFRDVERTLATVLFTDIVDSTQRAEALGDRRWRDLLDAHDALVRAELARFGGREVNRAGDGFLATFDGPVRAIRCAQAIVAAARELDLAVRTGLHTGECERRGDDIAGLAVHIGARVAAEAGGGEVLVSSTVKDLVLGSGIAFDDRGMHTLKGVDGQWHLFAAVAST
ncbi:MAG TPA: adenylate/guanylate cyclase domain-containing protein [Acidimicrobiia bacterium]|nr:adenylate/guanylate cyclase domain-containing protein [Acidimicrobiia bacterium]